MTEQEGREAVVRVALEWEATPFVWNACIKKVGVDCGRYLAAVFNEAGVTNIDIDHLPQLPPMWFQHRDSGSYLNQILQFAEAYDLPSGQKPQPGDMVVVRYGYDWAHGAIVINWPAVIGACPGTCVTRLNNIFDSPAYANREMKFLDQWRKRD